MTEILSAAEEAGIPFEKRCELAMEHLRETWKLIQEMATISLNSQQTHTASAAKARPRLLERFLFLYTRSNIRIKILFILPMTFQEQLSYITR